MGTKDCVKMEAAALVPQPPSLISLNLDNKWEVELSWFGYWVTWLLVSVVELIINTANFAFTQIIFPCFNKVDGKMNDQVVVVEKTIKDKIQKALNRRSTAGAVWSGGVKG